MEFLDTSGRKINDLEQYFYNEKVSANEKEKNIIVYIGTDSQNTGKYTNYVTVIIVRTFGRGGKVLYCKRKEKKLSSVKLKMLREIDISIQYAIQILPILDELNIEYEIHSDVNGDPTFKSNVALKEVVGYLRGMRYKYAIKPNAYAASYSADHILKKPGYD